MTQAFIDIATTPAVRAVREMMGSAPMWSGQGNGEADRFGAREAAFIAGRDSFYMASVSESGWPYVQHRGGPPGFVHLIDDRTFAFADYRGNRQYLSVGNLSADDRVCLIMVDYPHRARLKIYGHVDIVDPEAEPDLTARLQAPGYRAKVERIIRVHLSAFDWNCPQHITPRFTDVEIAEALAPLRERLSLLEAENAELRSRLTSQGDS